jgi:SWI/SNF-related matrix-associated actin-dependent regulator of chromatin subfamily A member 5
MCCDALCCCCCCCCCCVLSHICVEFQGHKIKNEESLVSLACRSIHSTYRLLITGTPMQNNMHELWSLLNFVYPDLFKSAVLFDESYNIDQTKHHQNSSLLSKAYLLLKPIMLRRVKSQVDLNLPPKTEVKVLVGLTPMQIHWYKALLNKEEDLLRQVAAGQATSPADLASGTTLASKLQENAYKRLMSLMMQLRKVCAHPYLLKSPEDYEPDEDLISNCGKMKVLDKLLVKLKSEGRRALIFSQFTSCLDYIEDFCVLRQLKYERLDGGSHRVKRSIDIARFNAPGSDLFVFLMSTRAGGLGISLVRGKCLGACCA